MRAQRVFSTVAILGLAAVGGLMARSFLTPAETPTLKASAAPAPALPQVLVATESLDVGSFVDPDSVRWQDWPRNSVLPAHLERGEISLDDLTGAVVRQQISEGEPIIDGKMVKPGDRGFLAAVLTPGMRAVSIAVNAVSGNAGLIFPGDRVDVILTQTLENGEGENDPARATVGETITRYVRVIAVDQRVGGENPNEGKVARTVTLEVTPRQAEVIAVGSELGRLALSLRSLGIVEGIEDEATYEVSREDLELPEAPTWAYEVSEALSPRGAANTSTGVLVLRGSETATN